ncbi:MAG TPA: hypothetical protein QF716_05065 [Candidatus Thalassarchaeaceae archaeon]|nr:hypothetical protein [Candidatus Thalassarchaeaceae archaeon]
MPTLKEWILIGAFVAFVLIPVCWKFWKGWDRPSLSSLLEMKRRIRERDMRDAFIEEDAKLREQHRLEAERELALRKAQAPPPVEKSILTSAFGNLGATDSTGTAVLEGSAPQQDAIPIMPVENVGDLVDSLETEGIVENVVPEIAPVAVQLHGDAGADEVKWDPSQDEDDWPDIGWT